MPKLHWKDRPRKPGWVAADYLIHKSTRYQRQWVLVRGNQLICRSPRPTMLKQIAGALYSRGASHVQ